MAGSRVGMVKRSGDAHFAARDEEEGYRLLYITVLESALDDLAEPEHRPDAAAWINGRDALISRDAVCSWIGITPERILAAAIRRVEDFTALPVEGLFG